MALSPGSRLGAFEILAAIGKGAMGEVYLARDTNLDRDVAIKVLPQALAQDTERLARFRHEAKILAALNHPNVATVHDFQDDGETRFLVMELVKGETLAELIAQKPLSVKRALHIFIQIAKGLDAAHEQGIVHRDLKPANVIISPDGTTKVLDFGIAKSTAAPASSPTPSDPHAPTRPGVPTPLTNLTAEDMLLGTPAYMSPEQARGKSVDRRTDIWAFGCCLYESLTGTNPYQGDTVADTINEVLERDPDWDRLPDDTPEEMRNLLRRCLEKDSSRRLSSAGDIAITLEHVSVTYGESPSGGYRTTDPPTASVSPRLKAAAGFCAVALFLFAALYLGRRGETSPEGAAAPSQLDAHSVRSLAVLPFSNLSGEEEQKYFVEAMTDALTSELAKIGALTVIAQTSTRAYKGTDKPARQIAEELGVDAFVAGSVYRAGNQVRITAQLVDGRSGEQFWSGAYEGNLVNIMQLQSDVALAIADQVSATLTVDERERIASVEPVSPEAYEAYVIGHYFLNEVTEEGLHTAIRYFKEATVLDPQYAHAWGGLVCAYMTFPLYGLNEPKEFYPKARAAGLRAIELNNDLAGDVSHVGIIAMAYDWEWEQAEERFLRAIGLSPSGHAGYVDYALYLMMVGRSKDATQYASTALDLNPRTSAYFSQQISSLVFLESTPDRTRQIVERILREKADYYPALETLALAQKYLGNYQAAIATAQRWVDLSDRSTASLIALARAFADGGEAERSREVLEELKEAEGYVDSAGVAYAYVALDELEEAFDWFPKGFEARDWGMVELRTTPYQKPYIDNPNWIRLRNDPRYWDFIERMNFPPFPAEHPGHSEDLAWQARRAAEKTATD